MPEDSTNKRKPRDLGNVPDSMLIIEIGEFRAATNTKLNLAATAALGFRPPEKDDLQQTEVAVHNSTVAELKKLRRALIDEGDRDVPLVDRTKRFRAALEQRYRGIEKIADDPEEFDKEVKRRVDAFKSMVKGSRLDRVDSPGESNSYLPYGRIPRLPTKHGKTQ